MRRVASEAERARVRAFFAENLADRTGLDIPSPEFDRKLEVPSILRIEEDEEGAIRGAAFASNDPDDVMHWIRQGNREVARLISKQLLMVHEIAVIPDARQSGLGTRLLNQVVDDGIKAGASIATLTFNDSSRGLERFYKSAGFVALPRGVQLELEFTALPRTTLGFPQTQPHYRWAYKIFNPSHVRYVGRKVVPTSSFGVAANKGSA